MLKLIFDHLKGHPVEYFLILVVVFGVGWQASSIADVYVNDKVVKAVLEETAPIKTQVAEVQKDLAMIQGGLNDLLASSAKREILEIRTLLCYTPGDTRLIRSYEDAQERYQDLTGSRFEPPPCDILKRPM